MESELISIPTLPPMPLNSELVRYTFEGTTNASGELTIVFPQPFPSNPRVFASIITSGDNYTWKFSSRTTTGCTVVVQQRLAVTILGLSVPLFAPTPVSGVIVNIAAVQAP